MLMMLLYSSSHLLSAKSYVKHFMYIFKYISRNMQYIYLAIYISVDMEYICIQIFRQMSIYRSYISRQISIYKYRYVLGIRRRKIVKCLGSFGCGVKFWLGLHSPHLSLIPVLIKFKDRNISSLCEHQQYTLPQVQTISRSTASIISPYLLPSVRQLEAA